MKRLTLSILVAFLSLTSWAAVPTLDSTNIWKGKQTFTNTANTFAGRTLTLGTNASPNVVLDGSTGNQTNAGTITASKFVGGLAAIHQIYAVGDSETAQGTWESALLANLGSAWGYVNLGISGDRLANMGNRMWFATNTALAEYCSVWGGINDIPDDPSLLQMQNWAQSCYNQAHTNGVKTIGITLAPFGNYSQWTLSRQTTATSFNSWIMSGAWSNLDYSVDIYTPLVDVDGKSLKAAYDSGDGLHCNAAGYTVVGNSVFAAVTWTPNSQMAVSMLAPAGTNAIALDQSLRRGDQPYFVGLTVGPGISPYGGSGKFPPGFNVVGQLPGNGLANISDPTRGGSTNGYMGLFLNGLSITNPSQGFLLMSGLWDEDVYYNRLGGHTLHWLINGATEQMTLPSSGILYVNGGGITNIPISSVVAPSAIVTNYWTPTLTLNGALIVNSGLIQSSYGLLITGDSYFGDHLEIKDKAGTYTIFARYDDSGSESVFHLSRIGSITASTVLATNGIASLKQGTTAPIDIWTNVAAANAPTYWTNYTGLNGTAYIGGSGEVSNVWKNAISIGHGTNTIITVNVPVNGWIGIGYTAAPTMYWEFQ